MDIKRAKEEIRHTIEAYLMKNSHGEYMIPSMRQRPVLLMGPPGNRKDADHGAGGKRMRDRPCGIHDHASYKAECDRPAVYIGKGVRRGEKTGYGVYHERDRGLCL